MAGRGTDITSFKRTYSTRVEGDFPETLTVELKKESDQKYGENPNQPCAIYTLNNINQNYVGSLARLTNLQSIRSDEHGKGGLSLNNNMDITGAMDTLKFFNMPAVTIMKHTIVSGFAKKVSEGQSLADLFRLARDSDRQSNFGGTFVSNVSFDMQTAEAIYELRGESPFFVDVVAAPEYDTGVVDYIQKQSKNVRIAQFSNLEYLPKFKGDKTHGLMSFKDMPTGRIGVQGIYLTSIRSAEDLIFDPKLYYRTRDYQFPTKQELDDLLTAWWLNVGRVKSNGIVAVTNGVTTAIGSGQVERFGAGVQAIIKGIQKAMDREGLKYDPLMGILGCELLKNNPFRGACVSSDAFFPFADSIDLYARVGVRAIIQPYGSQRDAEVIDAANRHGIAMPATLERCFLH